MNNFLHLLSQNDLSWPDLAALAIGIFFAPVGIYLFISNLRFRMKAVQTEGEVVAEKARSGTRGVNYSPVIRFTTREGKTLTFISDFRARMGMPEPGDKVKVIYNPEKPHHVKWDNIFFLWVLPWLLVLLGMVFIFMVISKH